MQTSESSQGSANVVSEAAKTAPGSTTSPLRGEIAATAPGQLRVIKRNGTVVSFEASKISVAITKAFLAVEGGTAAASSRIHDMVAKLTEQKVTAFFESDIVTKTRTGKPKARPTIAKTRRVLRMTLTWAHEHKLIATVPVPEKYAARKQRTATT